MTRRIHIINRCDICSIENLLPDASEDELGIEYTGENDGYGDPIFVPTIPLVDDDWTHYEGKDYCPDCALTHVSAPEYFPDTLEEAAL